MKHLSKKDRKFLWWAIIIGALIGTIVAFVFPLSHFFKKVKKQETPIVINIQENMQENGTLTSQEKETLIDFNAAIMQLNAQYFVLIRDYINQFLSNPHNAQALQKISPVDLKKFTVSPEIYTPLKFIEK